MEKKRGSGAGPATMTSRTNAAAEKRRKDRNVGEAKIKLGGTCHNDKLGLEGEKSA